MFSWMDDWSSETYLTTELGEEDFGEDSEAEEYRTVVVAPAPISLAAYIGPTTFATWSDQGLLELGNNFLI